MLRHPTLEKLYQLRLHGMAKAFAEQMEQPQADGLSFAVRTAAPTGPATPSLACALGQKACRDGFKVTYRRAPRLFSEIEQAKGEGRHLKFLAALAKTDLLIID